MCTCVYSFFVSWAKKFPVVLRFKISCHTYLSVYCDAITKYHRLHDLSRIYFFIILYCGMFRFKILVDLLTDSYPPLWFVDGHLFVICEYGISLKYNFFVRIFLMRISAL